MRRPEAEAVCEACGFEAIFTGLNAGEFELSKTTGAIVEAVRQLRPGAIFLPFIIDDHDDHRRVNQALMQAWQSEAGLGSPEIWGYQVYTPLPGNVAVDITDVADAKACAIRGYASQMAQRDWAHFALGLNAFNCRLLHGRSDACLIESFVVLPVSEYIDLCRGYFEQGEAYYNPNYAGNQ